MMLALSWLMISNVRYPSFKKVDWRTRGNLGAIVLVAVLIVMTVQFRYVMPVVIFSAYLIYGLVRPWVSQRWRREIEVEQEPEEETPATLAPPADDLPPEA